MAAQFVLSAGAQIIASMYGIAKDINTGIDKLIDSMKDSDHPTVERTGRVLESAKVGFNIGYITPIAVVAVGQVILGNPFVAVEAGIAMAFSPFAMTCAAVGAIIYGWSALTKEEQTKILNDLSASLEIGVELIRSIVSFVISKSKEILSVENLNELKEYIRTVAATAGRTIGDITRKVSDVVSDGLDTIKKKTGESLDAASDVYRAGADAVGKTAGAIKVKAAHTAAELREKFEKSPGK